MKIPSYALYMVLNTRTKTSQFLFGVSDLVKTNSTNAMLLRDMNPKLMTHAQQDEEDKIWEMSKEKNFLEHGIINTLRRN